MYQIANVYHLAPPDAKFLFLMFTKWVLNVYDCFFTKIFFVIRNKSTLFHLLDYAVYTVGHVLRADRSNAPPIFYPHRLIALFEILVHQVNCSISLTNQGISNNEHNAVGF